MGNRGPTAIREEAQKCQTETGSTGFGNYSIFSSSVALETQRTSFLLLLIFRTRAKIKI